MKSLDPIKLLRVCVGESAAWASLPLTSTVPGESGAASCSRGSELDDTGRGGNQKIQNVTAYKIIWLLPKSVWGGHRAEAHRLLPSLSTWMMCSSLLARFPFSKGWNREFLQVPGCGILQIPADLWVQSLNFSPVLPWGLSLVLLTFTGSQHCSLSTGQVQLSWDPFLAQTFGSIPELPDVCSKPVPELGRSRWPQRPGFLAGWGSCTLFSTLRCWTWESSAWAQPLVSVQGRGIQAGLWLMPFPSNSFKNRIEAEICSEGQNIRAVCFWGFFLGKVLREDKIFLIFRFTLLAIESV